MLSDDQKKELLKAIRAQFVPDWHGYHAIDHWERVRQNGLDLARFTRGADPEVVELFAYFHDAGRHNEGDDPEHGHRGAMLAREFRGEFFDCSREQLQQLCFAAQFHSDGLTEGDPTVRACWDADRLDLPRVGVTPDPEYLCTEYGKHIADARHYQAGSHRLRRTRILDDAGQPALMFHGTEHQGDLEPAQTRDGGLHFGTYDQARMRGYGDRRLLVPSYLVATNPARAVDTGSGWKDKIRRAQREGHDAIVYLNRWEGVTTERIDYLNASGMLPKLNAMGDREFLEWVPEARHSVIVWDSAQILQLPPLAVPPKPRAAPRTSGELTPEFGRG